MTNYKRILLISIVGAALTSCSSLESLLPSSSTKNQSKLRPAPSVPEVIPSAAGTPQPDAATPPATDLNTPTDATPDATAAPTTTTTSTAPAAPIENNADQPTSNVIPVGKGAAPTNVPSLKKKTPPPSGPSVLPQPNMQ